MHNDMTTQERVSGLVAEILHKEKKALPPETSFESLGADSLDMFEIIVKLESTFGVEINDERAGELRTIGQATELINELKSS